MPFPIMPINDKNNLPDDSNQDITHLIPLMVNPLTILQDFVEGNNDRKAIKEIWLKSESLEDGDSMKVSTSISDRQLMELRGKGLIDGNGRVVSLTERGKKILRDSILNDEQSALSKKASLIRKASKKLIAKNSYDFGNEVLVRTNKEKFGARYISVSKTAFCKKSKAEPREITAYTFNTKNQDGSPRKLADYSEEDLVQVLHLVKRVVSNKDGISRVMASRGEIFGGIPENRMKSFTKMIVEELNSR